MGLQKHSKVLNDTVEMLSDEGSYHQLFHAYRDEEALPSGEVLKEIIDLCRAILFPGYYGNARISKQTIHSAIRALEADPLMAEVLGPHIYTQYIAGKEKEWEEYCTRVSSWEIAKYMVLY